MRLAVVVVGVASLFLATATVVRRRATVREAPPAVEGLGFGERLAIRVARTAGMVTAALVAGIAVLGLGGRLMMRTLAVTSPSDAQGRITDAEEVVGQVTTEGTFVLVVVLGAAAGILGLAGFGLLRRWLPQRTLLASLLAAGVGAGLLARPSGFIDPDNPDFALLSPTWLAVLFCVGLLILFALLLGVLVDRWAPRWPRPAWSITGVASVLPIAVLAFVPPMFAAVLLVIGVGTLAEPVTHRRGDPGRLEAAGRVVVCTLGLLGGAWTLVAAGQILSA